MDKAKSPFASLLSIFNKLTLQQRLILGGISVVAVVMVTFILFAFNEPNYTTLYNNLAPEEANEVVQYLTSRKTPYKLEDGGNRIKVSKTDVYELRLALAGKGIPASGTIGYEIFDKNTIGMSEFMQKLNYKRALEGEISRTIVQQKGVESARIHIVTPKKAVFKEEQRDATASVVLGLRGGTTLSQNNIQAIANLVSASIEGLDVSKVTIIDTKGRLLSKKPEEEGLAISSGKQYEMKSNVEKYLADKAQSILDKVLGYDNSDVKVNVDLDFKEVEKTLETYDPESQVAISEQTSRNTSSGITMSDSNQVFGESNTINYELSKTIEHVIEGAGNIQRITVAAVINGVKRESGTGENVEIINEPRTPEQLQQLELLIRQSIGIDETRNDQVSIVSIPFETNTFENMDSGGGGLIPEDVSKYFNYLLLLIGIGGALFVLKGLMQKLKDEKITIGTVGGGSYSDESFDFDNAPTWDPSTGETKPLFQQKKKKRDNSFLEIGDIEDEISDEAVMKKMKQEKIVNYVSKNPSEAAKLINSWLREDEQ